MPIVKKNTNKKDLFEEVVISDQVKDRGDDPYFIKKAEEAKAFMLKHPIPDHLKK